MKKIKEINFSSALLYSGLTLFVLGFIFLYLVDRDAKNIFSFISPLFFVSGILLIAISFLF